jgi:hypothetical protein
MGCNIFSNEFKMIPGFAGKSNVSYRAGQMATVSRYEPGNVPLRHRSGREIYKLQDNVPSGTYLGERFNGDLKEPQSVAEATGGRKS